MITKKDRNEENNPNAADTCFCISSGNCTN